MAWIIYDANGAPVGNAYTDSEAISAVEGEATLDLGGAVGVTGLLTVLAGLDLNSADSIANVGAAGNDWTQNALTLAGGSSNQLIKVLTTGAGNFAQFEAALPASATAQARVNFVQGAGSGAADNMQYNLGYDAGSGYFNLRSADTDGGSTDADIFRVVDGGEVMTLNADHGANFDFVCETCGRHEAETFDCCGLVEWHDDVALMMQVGSREPTAVAMMHKLGVMRVFDDGWLGWEINRFPDFAMSAMAQQYQRTSELEARMAALEQAVA